MILLPELVEFEWNLVTKFTKSGHSTFGVDFAVYAAAEGRAFELDVGALSEGDAVAEAVAVGFLPERATKSLYISDFIKILKQLTFPASVCSRCRGRWRRG